MDLISQIIGRFHPLVVHFPIGILFVAFFFELISRWKSYENLRPAVQPALLIGVISAIISVITGLYLSDEGGYEDDLLERHKWLGIATAGLSVIVYGLRRGSHRLFREERRKSITDLISLITLIVFVSLTGHFGGSMTHGADYLFASVANGGRAQDPAIRLQSIQNVDSAVLYADLIQPILESRCYSCHSATRQKGDLRLDNIEFIKQGGEGGAIIEAGIPDSSSLFVRLMLPLDHDDHMPPNEKPQPSSAEIALIQSWIKEGADFEIKVSGTREHAKIKTYFSALLEQANKEKLIPEEAVSPANGSAVADLKKSGVIILPVAAESNYLSISFINKRSISQAELSLLSQMKLQAIWLDASRTAIGDKDLSIVGGLSSLRRLNLQNTAVSDEGLAAISSLRDLQYLNLAGTRISDKGIIHLSKLNRLRQLFLYQTDVTAAGIQDIKTALPDIEIDTGGYVLPRLLTDSVIVEFDPK
jgi:uncharacterized membrane protein